MPAIDTGTAVVNGTHPFYEVAGSGSPVVLIHGGNLDRRIWDPQLLPFAREHRVIRYDLRGLGKSGPADAPYQAHEDLRALLAELHVERASLVGLSGGARIAIDLATLDSRYDPPLCALLASGAFYVAASGASR